MKPSALRAWLDAPRFWDALCALAEGTLGGFKQIFTWWLPKHRREQRRKPKPSFWPTFEALEMRQVMTTVEFQSSAFTISEGGGTATITVTLDAAATVTVDYATSNGTALQPGDYTSASGTLSWGINDPITKTFTVTIASDALDENNETVNLALTNNSGASLGTNATAVLTITDDDATPSLTFSSSSSSAAEGNNPTSNSQTVFIWVSAASGLDITVPFTLSGTATQGTDYTISSNPSPLTIPAGATSGIVTVAHIGDSIDEFDETCIVTMGTPTNATLGATTVYTATITDDDNPPQLDMATTAVVNETAGTRVATVQVGVVATTSGKTITVDYATSAGTATAGSDYTTTSGTLTINPGMGTGTISVPILDDATPEADETFVLTLSNPSNATLSFTPTQTVTIKDNETTGITEFDAALGPWAAVSGSDGNLWITLHTSNQIGKVTSAGVITKYSIPSAGSNPRGITEDDAGNFWFTEYETNKIGMITTGGTITEHTVPTAASHPLGIAAGSDGNVWFVESTGNKIGKITPAGTITEYTIPTASSGARAIALGLDGNLWFTEQTANKIGKITPDGTITEYSVPTASSQPYDIVAGPDGRLHFTEYNSGKLGQITTGGTITEATTPVYNKPTALTVGPDNNIWVLEENFDGINSFNLAGGTSFAVSNGFSPLALAKDVVTGPDGHVWITEYGQDQLARAAFGTHSNPPTGPPGGPTGSIDVGLGAVYLLTGDITIRHDLDDPMVGPDCGCGHADAPIGQSFLVYNSTTATQKPIVEATFASDAQGAVPTQLEARLNWNSGGFGSWTTFATTGHVAGAKYLLALQSSTSVSSSGSYGYTIEVKATFTGGHTFTRAASGTVYLQIHTGTSSIAPGWSVRGIDKLQTVGTSDVLWLYGAGGKEFFRSLGSGASDRAAMITGQMLAIDGGLLTGFGEDLRAIVRKRMDAMKAGKH